ncbi:hypothetical protein B0H13DRAFT_2527807 [Mycena leptocephala]|nr:hypothetical protein B0H13DRAFT_2527807 [Mycena leptocephala]
MPVTLKLTEYRTTPLVLRPVTSSQILEKAYPAAGRSQEAVTIVQYNIGGWTGRQNIQFKILPKEHGFVNALLSAYTGNYALVICPHDVWLAVISQLSLYVNANRELLFDEASFVPPEPGKGKPLEIAVDTNSMPLSARQIGGLIQRNVLDPAVRDWVLPNFCTSTPNDVAVASMLWMAPTKVKKVLIPNTETLRRGIPRVTLEGGQGDWDSLLKKLERLKEYGIHLLYPVVSRFSKSFGAPDSPENWEFWKKVVHGEGDGGRSSKLSGWITAFCVFAFEGKWRIPGLETVSLFFMHYRSDLLSSIMTASAWKEESRHATFQSFWSTYAQSLEETSSHMTIDGTKFPVLNIHDLPAGYAEVDITVNRGGIASPCLIVAGLTGVGFSSSRHSLLSLSGRNDTVRAVVVWWLFPTPQTQPQPPEDEPKIIISPELTIAVDDVPT